ncbi:protein Gemin2 [Teleopsis dalmanni]|uniref:protein Gemin2 n=1 Tax=Teleopsis dalmanni TaxID=139649 RepID=UPI0018CE6FEB|nr:protein Gemin2 [Teleopsis dalmanni]XP_037934902.1 protein Gemin2 [Teleopsis dalmanni]
MEDDNDDGSRQRQALDITEPGPDFDPNATPENGDEYLTHMLYERQRCPKIVKAHKKKFNVENKDPERDALRYMKNIQNLQESTMPTLDFLPNEHWKRSQEQTFLVTRCKTLIEREKFEISEAILADLPDIRDAVAWKKFCIEKKPLLSLMFTLGQRRLEVLLNHIKEWLNKGTEDSDSEETCDCDSNKDLEATVENADLSRKTENNSEHLRDEEEGAESIDEIKCTTGVPQIDLSGSQSWLGLWLYAVLVCLEIPLEGHVIGTLREIARSCIRLRCNIAPSCLEKVTPCNLFIFLIAKVFAQFDLIGFV